MPLPPGCTQPMAVQTARWMARPTTFLRECHDRFGDDFSVNMAIFGKAVFVSDPENIKAVFTASPEALGPGTGNAMLMPLLGRHSLILLDRQPHRRERRLLTPPFHGERMRAYAQVIHESTQTTCAAWPLGQAMNLTPELQNISLDVILSAVFGVADLGRRAAARRPVVALLEGLNPLTLYVPFLQQSFGPWAKTMAERRAVHALVDEEIRDRRERGLDGRSDILSLMMAARYEDGAEMSDEALRDEMMTMLIAGHETSTTSLSWAVWELMDNPDAAERLTAELDALGADAGPEALERLPYLDAICRETLRLHPVLPLVSRITRAELPLRGFTVPANVGVFPCIWLAHRREEVFPEPERFRPERFLERTYSPFEWLPFGGGARRCIGMAFALYEMKLVLGALFRRFHFKKADDKTPQTRRKHITIAPSGGVRAVLAARGGPHV